MLGCVVLHICVVLSSLVAHNQPPNLQVILACLMPQRRALVDRHRISPEDLQVRADPSDPYIAVTRYHL